MDWMCFRYFSHSGPASKSAEMFYTMMEYGMNIARINLSHGSHEVLLL